MSIESFSLDKVINTLKIYVSAAQPERSIKYLYGRNSELQRIDEALQADGWHLFIYGDRGVGKSSLAASAEAQFQSSDNIPITIPCGPDTTFYNTVETLCRNITRQPAGTFKHDISQKLNILRV